MKAGIVGMGTVGRAAAAAMLQRGSCRELVLVNRRREVAEAVALDLRYGVPVGPAVTVRAGDYDDLRGAGVVVIAAGVNEKSGGATDRNDPEGRLKLIDANVPVMRAVVPPAVAAAPDAVLLLVPDPPDPLADLARQLAGHDRVVSSGTLLDSLRFRTHLAEALGVDPRSVQANVLGEHGTSAVEHWSAVEVGGVPLAAVLERVGKRIEQVRPRVEDAVRGANLNIIQGIGASQYGIGAVTPGWSRPCCATSASSSRWAPTGPRRASPTRCRAWSGRRACWPCSSRSWTGRSGPSSTTASTCCATPPSGCAGRRAGSSDVRTLGGLATSGLSGPRSR